MTDKRIETYLRKSTRGLWGKKREEVREELATHIEGRVHAHLVGGLSEGDAIEKTLIELGHPTNVSAGMARLYTLPVVAGSGVLLAMCSALVVVLLAGSTAQTLKTVNVVPADECLEPKGTLPKYCEIYDSYTTIEALKEALENQGVKLSSIGDVWTLKFPDNHTVVIPSYGSGTWTMQDIDGRTITLYTRPEYKSMNELIDSFVKSTKTTVRLEGWERPTLYVDQTLLEISSAVQEGGASKFYGQRLADALLDERFSMPDTQTQIAVIYGKEDAITGQENTKTESKRFELGAEKDTVYGIAILLNPEEPFGEKVKDPYDIAFYADLALANNDGSVNFQIRIPEEGLTFKNDTSKLSNFGDAVIVRLSGELKAPGYEVIPPDQIKLE